MRTILRDRHGSNAKFELVSIDPQTGQAVLRGDYDDYVVQWDMSPEAKAKRALNYIIEQEP